MLACTFTATDSHFDFDIVAPYIKECKTKMAVFNHIKFPNERIPLLEKESEKYLFKFFIPNDGDVIEL